jgi:LacI family transcriptional regulator, gluconate utilization system Gnt-I transcriptional repressor
MTEFAPPKKSRRSSGALTLRDVAALAGVSPITASRALNSPDQVSAALLKKVHAAVARTGYVPNRAAGALASSRSRLIAAVTPSTVMSVFMGTIEALNAALFDADYQLMLGQSSYSAAREETLLEAIIGRRPDGVFLTGILPPGKGRTMLVASGIPVVETWDLTPTPIDMLIGFSHEDIGADVANFLAKKGYKRFGLVRAADARADRRARAFKAALAKRKLPQPTEINVGESRSIQSGRQSLIKMLDAAPNVEAIFCSSDLLAIGVLMEAQARGLRIPDDLAIMGFGDVQFAAEMSPAISSVRINSEEIGRIAARYLIDRAEGRVVNEPIVNVGYAIIERDST